MYNKIIERERNHFLKLMCLNFDLSLSLSENHDDDANNDKITSKH